MAELGVDRAVRRVAAGGDIDVLKSDSAVETHPDVPRFAIVLPVVPSGIAQRDAAENGYSVMHALAVERVVDVAVAVEEVGREDGVEHLGFLEAENVRLLLGDQALDQRDARAHRVDVPRSDLQPITHVRRLPSPGPQEKGPRSGGLERGPAKRSSRKGFHITRVTGGNPGKLRNRDFI